jgi:hypothetical protein
MYDMTPLVYCLSTFWGYRLLKQCRMDGGWFQRLLAPVFGLILLLGPWMIGIGNPTGLGLLAIAVLAMLADMVSNRSSAKTLFQLMAHDEKLLFFVSIVGATGWGVYQLM